MIDREYNIVFQPKVKLDLQEAIDYYNKKQKGLGNNFYYLAKKLMESLSKDAFLYEIRFDDTRFLKVGKFPYVIYYYIDNKENTVYIDAIKCTYLNPEKHWKKRDF